MRWKQFFTPVKSINTEQAREFMETKSSEELTTLDVRQPTEYEAGHIPGAKLIPLPDLTNRLSEIDHNKPVMVY
jgi:rhodanese-related sulfurtransferase